MKPIMTKNIAPVVLAIACILGIAQAAHAQRPLSTKAEFTTAYYHRLALGNKQGKFHLILFIDDIPARPYLNVTHLLQSLAYSAPLDWQIRDITTTRIVMDRSMWKEPGDYAGVILIANPLNYAQPQFLKLSSERAFDVFYAIHLHNLVLGPDVECVKTPGYSENNPGDCFYGLHFFRAFSTR